MMHCTPDWNVKCLGMPTSSRAGAKLGLDFPGDWKVYNDSG